jgi:hypothetical protein
MRIQLLIEKVVNAALVGANTVNGPVPCKVTANSAFVKA